MRMDLDEGPFVPEHGLSGIDGEIGGRFCQAARDSYDLYQRANQIGDTFANEPVCK